MRTNISKRKQTIFRKRKDAFWDIAKVRIDELFALAQSEFKEDVKLADRYVELARKLSMKYKVPLTKSQKMSFCRNCGSYLENGINSKIRLSGGNVVLHCLKCKFIRRFKYK
jgi:ribonuclease P protein subunit RPR2